MSQRRRRLAAVALLVVLTGAAGWAAAQAAATPPGSTIRIGVGQRGGGVRVETLPLEDYVARVVSGEGQPRAAAAAQQALAIVIRTFAVANRNRHRGDGYDLCDTTHCQVMRPVLPAARLAAQATAGQMLLDRGLPALVFYSAHNGGTPALASEVWPGATDYAPGEAHDACDDEPGWTSVIPASDVERAVRAAGLRGRLRGLSIIDRTPSGRAGRLRVDGFAPDTLTAHEFRTAIGRTLGWQLVKSTAFDVSHDGRVYRFEGVGYGHGVGLCVVGAGKRAARGETAAAILRAYFRDLTIAPGHALTTLTSGARATTAAASGASATTAAPSVVATPSTSPLAVVPAAIDVRLMLPPGNEPEREELLRLVRAARDDVALRALLTAPALVTVTAHPTLEAFSQATGQPWWASAATVGTAIDLAPVHHLRQRGLLEATIRYEVAWAVLAPALPNAPAWVKVGAAMIYAAAPSAATTTDGRITCPTDAEVLRPLSGGAQRDAWLRAERCVRREISRGRAITSLR